eukprot:6019539-Karenia_brevis.AAC.1
MLAGTGRDRSLIAKGAETHGLLDFCVLQFEKLEEVYKAKDSECQVEACLLLATLKAAQNVDKILHTAGR